MEAINCIHLSYNEYATLMCMFDAKNLYGTFIDEKYLEMSSAEIESVWKNCEETLSNKGYIDLTADGVSFNIALYYLLTECINAKKIFNIQISSPNKKIFDNTYYLNDKTLISVINDENIKEVRIRIQTKMNVFEDVFAYIEITTEESHILDRQQIEISEQEYFSLIAGINTNNTEKIHTILSQKVSSEYESNIISALTNRHTNISITEYSDTNDRMYAFISNDSDFWAVSSNESGNIVFQSTSVDDIRDTVSELLNLSGGK